MFQSIKTNIQRSDERCLRSRRAFNVLKGGRKKAGLTLPTFNAIDAMKDTLKTRAAIEWDSSIFNRFVATEARMVWQLGLLYYFLIFVALGDDVDESVVLILQLLTGYVKEAIQDEKTLAMYEIYDYLDSQSNDVFVRELFDGSIQTLQGMIDFLTPLGILPNGVVKSGCRSFPTVDLNKVEARGTKYTYDGRPLTKSKSLGRGTFGQVDLYTTSRNESVAIKTYLQEDDEELALLRDVTDFATCNVIGVRLLNDKASVMTPANGSLYDFKMDAGGDVQKKARTLVVEVAEMYRCMIERRNLYYFDIKLQNVLYTCDAQTGRIKCLIGDVGGLAKEYESATTTFITPLPFKHVFMYLLDSKKVMTYPIDDFVSELRNDATATTDVDTRNIVEGTMYVYLLFEGKHVILLAEDGPTMLRKFKALVGIEEEDTPKQEEGVLCAVGESGRCKKSDRDDGNCYYNSTNRRCQKKKKLIVKLKKKKKEKKRPKKANADEILCAMSAKGRCKKSDKADGKCAFYPETKRCRKLK